MSKMLSQLKLCRDIVVHLSVQLGLYYKKKLTSPQKLPFLDPVPHLSPFVTNLIDPLPPSHRANRDKHGSINSVRGIRPYISRFQCKKSQNICMFTFLVFFTTCFSNVSPLMTTCEIRLRMGIFLLQRDLSEGMEYNQR